MLIERQKAQLSGYPVAPGILYLWIAPAKASIEAWRNSKDPNGVNRL